MAKEKYIDIDMNDDQKAEYLAILNSDYFDCHPDDDLETAFEVLHGDGISNFFNCYPFTHEQALEINKILEKKFDSKNVIRFIIKLRSVAEGATCLLDQTDFKTYKNDRKSMLALLGKCSALLNSIRDGRGIYHLSNYTLLIDAKRQQNDAECQELAVIVGDLLSMLIRKMKLLDDSNEKHLKGRPTADSKGIVTEIAKIWETCFNKKPTKYSGGPFEEVVQIVLKGLNLPYEYPQRKIRSALKK